MNHILRTTLARLVLWLTLPPAGSALADAKAWQPAAGPYGGSLAALALSPDYPVDDTVFAGLRGQSVYRTSDGGLWRLEVPQGGSAETGAWESHGPRGGMAQAMAVSPYFAQDGVAFAGEWRDGRHGDQTGLGFFKSTRPFHNSG
jgi:hypothetical protein